MVHSQARSRRGVDGIRVAIIGSGFSGIAAAVEMQRQGIHDITIFEKAGGIGGTWWHNRYPGAEVDLESHIYSFSYEPWDWSRTHAGWKELLGYLHAVADKHGLTQKVRLNEKVERATWDEAAGHYRIETSSGHDHGAFTAVVSAVGFLNIPVLPPFARGNNDFAGEMCHTSTWPEDLNMTGKSVAVVGTGSSAVQVAPEAAKVASSVTIFQLEPNWLLPKNSRDFTPAERRRNRRKLVNAVHRGSLYLQYDARQVRSSHAKESGIYHRKRAKASLAYLTESLKDHPELRELVTPEHPFEGKRTVVSDTYYELLKDPKVSLVPHGVREVTSAGVVDTNGDKHDMDVVVLATGFDAANYLGNYEVVGDGGTEIHQVWNGEPEAFLGMMVPGFPNFFIMYGPNTNSIPLVTFYEAQARFAATLVARMARSGKRRIDVRPQAHRRYNERVQAQLARTVWAGTSNYFRAGTGKVVTQWPFSASAYMLATRVARRLAVTIR